MRLDSVSPERTMSSTTPDDADSQPDEQAVLSHLVRRLLQREGGQIPLERITLGFARLLYFLFFFHELKASASSSRTR